MNDLRNPQLPDKLFAEAVVRSASGQSLLRSPYLITSENVTQFHATPEQIQLAADRLRAAGFEVLNTGKTSINIAAAPEVYARSLGAKLEVLQRPVIRDLGQRGMAEFINSADQSPLGEIDITDTAWHDLLDGVALNEPAYFLRQAPPSATPPPTNTRYLQVPDDLATELSANLAHERGITGKGVKVVVVDSGCYAEHSFFKHHNYQLKVELGPGSTNPEQDTSGHGTGVAANLLAIAPGVDLTVLKSDVALGGKFRNINSTAAFRTAVSLRPDIISCSWGSDLRSPDQLSSAHKVLAAAIAEAVRQGIVVVFAAGNGQWGFPSQHPDVIAVGGVYKYLEGSLKGQLEASNYASSFISAIYPGRRVPDVCGLVGRLPNAAYIMLPVPPGSEIDRGLSGVGDETEAIDGWAAFSGTSSAAPQLAGACALLEQFIPGLGPLKIKQILQETASDIIEGNSNPATGGELARAGPDLATGYGLAVADKAIQAAQAARDQRQRTTSFAQPSSSTILNETTDFRQNSIHSHHTNHQGINIMASLDESTLRKLRIKLDEIQIDLNDSFKKKYPDLADQNIELVIGEGNFIEQTPDSKAISILRETLREIEGENGEIKANSITRKHIFAAESLLKRSKCRELAKIVLVTAMKLAGKVIVYKIDTEDGLKEIAKGELFQFTTTQIGSYMQITGPTSGNVKVGKKPQSAQNFLYSIIIPEVVDRDAIAELAAKALGAFGNLSSQDKNISNEVLMSCTCVNGRRICDGEDQGSC